MSPKKNNVPDKLKGEVWFAYDGDCPICTYAAHALRIRKNVGALHLVNARENAEHPLIQEINELELDLDEGMVLKFGNVCYHGRDALHMMALLGSSSGWYNRLNALLFRSKFIATLLYPSMRGVRNLLLRLKGVERLNNLYERKRQEPIFRPVFGDAWDKLPKVMQDRYAIKPFSDDFLVIDGTLDITVSPPVRLMSRLFGVLISRSGRDVPVSVTFRSGKDSAAFWFDRTFHFPEGKQHFLSRMEHVGGNQMIEFMRFGLGWKTAYTWDGEKVILSHRGFVWRIFGFDLPVPLGLILGQGAAEEIPVSKGTFRMWTHTRHPWFGDGLAYAGTFKISEFSCQNLS